MSTLSALLTASASSPLAYMSAVTFWLGRSRASYRPDPETSMSCSYIFFSSRRLHTRYLRDWSSDVCSSDLALLEADVALPVVRELIGKVRERAVGQEVIRSVSPAQQVVKIVNDCLVEALGGGAADEIGRAQRREREQKWGVRGSLE